MATKRDRYVRRVVREALAREPQSPTLAVVVSRVATRATEHVEIGGEG